jgi:hypothetical protein
MNNQTMTTEDIQIRVNDQLVQFDNLLTALDYLKQEITSRKTADLDTTIKKYVLEDEKFFRRFLNWFKRYQMNNFTNLILTEIKRDTQLNDALEEFFLSKLDARIELTLKKKGL